MIFLLDTNAISDLMRADQRVERWMAGLQQGDQVVTCTIVRGEVLFGISKLPQGKRRSELEATARQFLELLPCEPIPSQAAEFYAALKLSRQQRGLTLDENDLWIAATALALKAALVSRDGDFAGIDELTLVNLE